MSHPWKQPLWTFFLNKCHLNDILQHNASNSCTSTTYTAIPMNNSKETMVAQRGGRCPPLKTFQVRWNRALKHPDLFEDVLAYCKGLMTQMNWMTFKDHFQTKLFYDSMKLSSNQQMLQDFVYVSQSTCCAVKILFKGAFQ